VYVYVCVCGDFVGFWLWRGWLACRSAHIGAGPAPRSPLGVNTATHKHHHTDTDQLLPSQTPTQDPHTYTYTYTQVLQILTSCASGPSPCTAWRYTASPAARAPSAQTVSAGAPRAPPFSACWGCWGFRCCCRGWVGGWWVVVVFSFSRVGVGGWDY
jgi:hypothetical protein